MANFRLPRGLCAVVGESLLGSHPTLDALFISSGAPGEPPDLAHHSKWKEWLFRAGQDPEVDSLKVLGNILEEFMDVEPLDPDAADHWRKARKRIENALSEAGLEYYRGGRVIPNGAELPTPPISWPTESSKRDSVAPPSGVEELLSRLVVGLPRAMHPLEYRRKLAKTLSFESEYDVQDLLHAMMRPWIADIRAEEFVPSYAGSNTRMDFLLPAHKIVVETKFIRDMRHARNVGDELIIDISHYSKHPECEKLWCVVYDPKRLVKNVAGLVSDLSGAHGNGPKPISVKVVVV